jgi:replicative DNA helicase
LDRILNGVEAGELIVVSGPTSGGKTTLLMSITQNMAVESVNCAWFTLEVTPRQFITKISNRGTLPTFYLPRRGFEDVPKDFIMAFERQNGRQFQMFDWMEFKIVEASVKFNTRVIFIDHIHQLFSLAKISQSRNMSAEVGDLVAKIKNLAVTHNLVIFLIAHNRDDSENKNKDPYMESVRDSGLIIRYADTVIGIWRVANADTDLMSSRISVINESDSKSKIRVWKNRREGTRGAFYAFHMNHYLTEDAFHGFD